MMLPDRLPAYGAKLGRSDQEDDYRQGGPRPVWTGYTPLHWFSCGISYPKLVEDFYLSDRPMSTMDMKVGSGWTRMEGCG